MESKCPCGCPGALNDKANQYYRCENCWFQCDKGDLPRIAAAMELARLHKRLADSVGIELVVGIGEAEKRVLCEHGYLRRSCPICSARDDYASIIRELTELREAVRWERECQLVRHYVIFDALETCALREITRSISAARAAVDALVGGSE